MKFTLEIEHVCEIWTAKPAGPTGRFAEVLTGRVEDAGGNVYFSGSASECAREAARLRVPVILVPDSWEDRGEEVHSNGPHWQLVTILN